jgi:hypothetical protein
MISKNHITFFLTVKGALYSQNVNILKFFIKKIVYFKQKTETFMVL